MAPLGLDHVQLAMPAQGEAEARRFYGEGLGLEPRDKPEPLRARGGLWFEGGGLRLHLGIEPAAPGRRAHPAIAVADLGAALARLEAAGFPAERGTAPDGRAQAYLADPFGNRLELLEGGPPAPGGPRLAGPVIRTPRLLLRLPERDDFGPWCDMMADGEASRFIGGPQTPEVAWRGFASVLGSWTLEGFSLFSIVELETGRWIGRAGPWRPLGWPGNEVGWGLVRGAWGRGYATEAAAALLDHAFDVLGWSDVVHAIEPENAPSKRVAARLGSRLLREGTLPPPLLKPVEVWGQSAAEWRARRAGAARSTPP